MFSLIFVTWCNEIVCRLLPQILIFMEVRNVCNRRGSSVEYDSEACVCWCSGTNAQTGAQQILGLVFLILAQENLRNLHYGNCLDAQYGVPENLRIQVFGYMGPYRLHCISLILASMRDARKPNRNHLLIWDQTIRASDIKIPNYATLYRAHNNAKGESIITSVIVLRDNRPTTIGKRAKQLLQVGAEWRWRVFLSGRNSLLPFLWAL